MSEQQRFTVEAAPSLDAIVAASGGGPGRPVERVGTVDFGARAEPGPAEPDGDALAEEDESSALVSLLAASRAARPAARAVAPDQAVEDIAAAVSERMRAVGEAHERHLEARELEAARHLELLTAQAELDAELIRLHARRQARAVVEAARLRAGDDEDAHGSTEVLDRIGESFSRFAESIETTLRPEGPTDTVGRW